MSVVLNHIDMSLGANEAKNMAAGVFLRKSLNFQKYHTLLAVQALVYANQYCLCVSGGKL